MSFNVHALTDQSSDDGLGGNNQIQAIIEESKLLATDTIGTTNGDGFGISSSVSGKWTVIGAYRDNDKASKAGAAYVFEFNFHGNATKSWQQVSKLTAFDGSMDDNFGRSVGIDGTRIIIGAPNANIGSNLLAGAAYVFEYDGTQWQPSNKLNAASIDGVINIAGDLFGQSVSVSGDRIIVGAPHDDEKAPNAGAVFLFDFQNPGWSGQKLGMNIPLQTNEFFGFSVAIDGKVFVAGAYGYDYIDAPSGISINNMGAAYVLKKHVNAGNNTWDDNTRLIPENIYGTGFDNAVADSLFGTAVSINLNHVLVGAYFDGLNNEGSATLFNGSSLIKTFTPENFNSILGDVNNNDQFGYSVAVTNNKAFVGAWREDENSMDSGSVYEYQIDENTSPITTLLVSKNSASDGMSQDFYGVSIATSKSGEPDSKLIVGAHKNDESATDAGAAYAYDLVAASYSVSVTASGMLANNPFDIRLLNNRFEPVDTITVTNDGVYEFPVNIDDGNFYRVDFAVDQFAFGQFCILDNGTGFPQGTINGANVTNLTLVCTPRSYDVSGTLTGYVSATPLVLELSTGNEVSLTANGSFTFPQQLDHDVSYTATVKTAPTSPNQTCSITNATGTMSGPVMDINVDCTTVESHFVGGTITGWEGGTLVLINNNNLEEVTISSNGVYQFPTAINFGDDYHIIVKTQPPHTLTTPSQLCFLADSTASNGGMGTIGTTDVTNIDWKCNTDEYFLNGNITGLVAGESIILQNNLADDRTITITQGASDPLFIMAYFLFDLENYAITVKTINSNTPKACTVTGGNSGNDDGSGFIDGADYTGILITCVENGYTLGGTINGLIFEGENSITLQNNGTDDYFSANNGVFQFQSLVADTDNYAVSVAVQPTFPNQTCVVTGGNSGNNDGTGTINGSADNSIVVNCTAIPYTLGGTVTGLSAGQSVELQNASADNLIVTSDGAFSFSTTIHGTESYAVTVLNQPSATKTCIVTGGNSTQNNGSGLMQNANNNSIIVTCTEILQYSVGGNVMGLPTGTSIVLQNNGTDDLSISSDGAFAFPTLLDDGSLFIVTVKTQPFAGIITCTVSGGDNPTGINNGTGVIQGANIESILVNCGSPQYTVGGSVIGLQTGDNLILQNNGGDDLAIIANGQFTFATALDDLSAYAVTIKPDATGALIDCSINGGNGAQNDGSGNIAGADVTNIMVRCHPILEYTVGGSVIGLPNSATLTLQNNAVDDLLINSNGVFTFATPLLNFSPYAVTISNNSQSATLTCTIVGGNSGLNNGSGNIAGADVTDIAIRCHAIQEYTVGGTVFGLPSNGSLTLQNNGTDDLLINTNGAFTFATTLTNLSPFAVTISNNPQSAFLTCSIVGGNSGLNDGSGNIAGADITDVIIRCSNSSQYSLGGMVTGLENNRTLIIQNNLTDNLVITSNGEFIFNTSYPDLSQFSVTVSQQPTILNNNENCVVTGGNSGNDNGTGAILGQDYLGLIITCNTLPVTTPDVYTAFEDIEFNANDANGTIAGLNNDGVFVNDVSTLPLSVVNLGNNSASGIGGSITMNADGTFVYIPPTDLFGMATYDYMVTDGVVTLTSSLSIEVLPVNDAPSFTIDGDIHEGITVTPQDSVNYFQFVDVNNVNFGPVNESSQLISSIEVSIINDVNNIIISTGINIVGGLFITYSGNIGTAKLGITLKDSGGTTNGGEDTSAVVEFNVTHEVPIYSNGFE